MVCAPPRLAKRLTNDRLRQGGPHAQSVEEIVLHGPPFPDPGVSRGVKHYSGPTPYYHGSRNSWGPNNFAYLGVSWTPLDDTGASTSLRQRSCVHVVVSLDAVSAELCQWNHNARARRVELVEQFAQVAAGAIQAVPMRVADPVCLVWRTWKPLIMTMPADPFDSG